MKKLKHLFFAFGLLSVSLVQAQYYYKLSTGNSVSTYEDASGLVGIGTTTPVCDLNLKCQNWYNPPYTDIPNPIFLFQDPDGNYLGGFSNLGTHTGNWGGAFVIKANPDVLTWPALGVVNSGTNDIAFAVLPDATILNGVIEGTWSGPEAQVNILKNNNYDFMLKVQNADQSKNYFDIDNDGHVGIGIASESAATEIIYETNTDTKLDFATTSTTYHNAIRLGRLASVTSGHAVFTPTHQITEADGDMVIDPGIASGGGNDILKVDGNEKVTGCMSVGVGSGTDMNAPSILGSTVALHQTYINDHTGPTLDFFQEDAVNAGWNAQIRFGRKFNDGAEQCAIRHIIADNYETGDLDIIPGYDLDGTHVGSGNHLRQIVRIRGNMVIGDHIITSGSHTGAKLFVDGKIAAKYVVVTESNWGWPDHVFNSNYPLRSLPDLESYIAANHHLPEVPDECEVEEKGVNVGEMNATLLKKIEELTLYVLAQQKQMDKMKDELNVLTNH